MNRRRTVGALGAVGALAALAVGGCSGGNSGGRSASQLPITHHHHHHRTATPTATPTPTPTATVTVTASPSGPAAPTTSQNLTVTPAVRKQLIKAGAATHQLRASDYTGLVPGRTFYGYDAGTATYWAGAGLVPSSSSQDAQISVQDDGSYLIFRSHTLGRWTAYNVGLAGLAGATCPVRPPPSITTLWHWAKRSCRPPS